MSSSEIDLACQQVVELVTEYLGDALTPDERARFEEHLRTCPPCTTYLAQIRTTIELAGQLGAERPDEVEQALLALFRRWHRP